jgi:hypothetical protein
MLVEEEEEEEKEEEKNYVRLPKVNIRTKVT